MKTTPVKKISSVSGTSQTDDETVKEYVVRVGEEHDVDRTLVEYALSYVTEYYYSDGIPDDSSGFESFLEEIARESGPETETPTADTPDTAERESEDDTREHRPSGPVVAPPDQSEPAGVAGFKTGIQGKEPRKLVVRFLTIVVTAPVIGWMLARAWVPGNVIYDQGRELLSQLLGLPGTEVTKLFVLFGFGLYLGLLTLFTILGLLDEPTTGRLVIDGTDTTGLSERERAQLRRDTIGFVFQDFQLIPDLTARENAMLPQTHGTTQDPDWIDNLLDTLEIRDRADHYPTTLSGGEKQRVAIARALANRPDLVLADEPTGQLDPRTTDQVVSLLLDVQESTDTALVTISHDPALEPLHDQTRTLRDGRLIAERAE